MDTSIKRMMEIAGVDITQGKARQLIESTEVDPDEMEQYKTRSDKLVKDKAAKKITDKEYGEQYAKLLKDLPEAHRAYVRAQNDRLWAGDSSKKDEKSNRSSVE